MFIFSQISFKIDQLLLSALPLPADRGLNNEQAVAVYSLPYKVFEVALVVPTFFMNSVYPILVRHLIVSKKKMARSFRTALLALLGVSFLVSVVGIAFSDIAVRFLGGEEFMQSSVVLKVLLAGLLIYYTTQPLSWFIVTLGYQKYLPLIYLVGATFNFTANYYLIPIYSYSASMLITHATELIILVLLCFFAKKSWDNANA
jgi:O-antigen/teichoic acid export membrane protein